MISSGDSGSGYAPNDPCEGGMGEKGTGIDGTLLKSMTVNGYDECCEEASQAGAKGWQFSEWAAEPAVAVKVTSTQVTPDVSAPVAVSTEKAPKGTIKFLKSPFHTEMINPNKPVFHNRDVFELTGTVTSAAGGTVKCLAMNGTKYVAPVVLD